jgi:hypothetical protein
MWRRRADGVKEAWLFHSVQRRSPAGSACWLVKTSREGDGRPGRLPGMGAAKRLARPIDRVRFFAVEEGVEVPPGDSRQATELDRMQFVPLEKLVDEGPAAPQREAYVANGEEGGGARLAG